MTSLLQLRTIAHVSYTCECSSHAACTYVLALGIYYSWFLFEGVFGGKRKNKPGQLSHFTNVTCMLASLGQLGLLLGFMSTMTLGV